MNKELILKRLKLHKSDFQELGIREVGLFGSYVRNEQNDESDIDILIDFFSDKENFDNYMAVYDLLENIFSKEKIEIVTKKGLSKYIGPQILKEVIYA